MKNKVLIPIIILLILIGGFFLFSSNNEQKNQETQTNNSKMFSKKNYSGAVSSLILNLSELPEGYHIAERALRLKSDVSNYSKRIGWKEGYYVRYLKGDTLSDISNIEVYISRYPLENISKTLKNESKIEGYISENLPDPKIGEGSKATRYTDNETGLRAYSIEFYKKDIYVRIDNGGTATDYEVLKELAKKVERKI